MQPNESGRALPYYLYVFLCLYMTKILWAFMTLLCPLLNHKIIFWYLNFFLCLDFSPYLLCCIVLPHQSVTFRHCALWKYHSDLLCQYNVLLFLHSGLLLSLGSSELSTYTVVLSLSSIETSEWTVMLSCLPKKLYSPLLCLICGHFCLYNVLFYSFVILSYYNVLFYHYKALFWHCFALL